MFRISIHRDGAEPSQAELPDGTYVIGAGERCRIRLPAPGVADRHAILVLRGGEATVEDMRSGTGTRLGPAPVAGPVAVPPGTPIAIGPYTLVVSPAAPAAGGSQVASPAAQAASPESAPAARDPGPSAAAAAAAAVRRDVKRQIHRELVDRLDIKRLAASRTPPEELRRRATETVDAILAETADRLPAGIDPARLGREILDEALGLGPLEELLADESVGEIMVNGPERVYVERRGRLELTDLRFMDDASVMAVVERIVAPLGRRVDESQPYVDARLPDGSRVNVVIHPLSLVGPCLTIRKFASRQLFDRDLVAFGTLTQAMADFLRACVLLRKNIVVSGGTGSGKTTLLNVLSNYLPHDERILTIEDAAELRLAQPHLVRLEARPPNIEGRGAVTIRDLVRNALRMRPDRIIVGECRGGEALDMLQAMNTGHDGSLTTVHANAPRDVVSRLETMVMMSGLDLPSRAIREQIASAVDLVVHESRLSDGSRKVVAISEIVGLEGTQVTMQDLFVFEQTGLGPDGRVEGFFKPTGAVPTFFGQFAPRGIPLDVAVFRETPVPAAR